MDRPSLSRRRPASLLALGLALCPIVAAAAAERPDVLVVDRPDDDGAAGSLRWAVERHNAQPGRYRIEIGRAGAGPLHIVLRSPLPPLSGRARITGVSAAETGRYDVIDGAGYLTYDPKACPAATPGQFGTNVRTFSNPGLAIVDTSDVEISHLEITGFCIGVLVLRSSRVDIHDNRITRTAGGAGVMFTGDDGAGNPTVGKTVNNKLVRNVLINNGDGAELTRGAAFNLLAENVFEAGEGNPEPGQGVEILRADDNVLVKNVFRNYSDGVQINGGRRNLLAANRMEGNAYGVSLTGLGNIVDSNEIVGNRFGVVVRAQAEQGGSRLTGNTIAGNGRPISRCAAGGTCAAMTPGPYAIAFTAVGPPTPGLPVASVEAPSPLPPAPVLQSAAGGEVRGRVRGRPGSVTTVEIFGARAPDEAAALLSRQDVALPATGDAPFEARVNARAWTYVSATATSADGLTSLLTSRPVVQSRGRGQMR